MLLVAFALSSVMFVACNKYDDDIERIDNEIASLQATVQSLKAAVDGGAVISSVSNTAEGVKFTLSNGQSYVVNHGTDGAAGAAGAAGKDGSVVTIGENGNWFIDGEDTGKTAKGQGEPGKAPRINEAGNWEIYNAETNTWEDTKVSAAGASTYVVDMGSYYQLNVMEQVDGVNAGFTAINLPKTSPITSLKAVTIEDNKINPAVVVLNYGDNLGSNVWFNGKKYAKGTNLIAAGASLSAIVNPVDADASVYSFSLMDSKGNVPYVISNVTENMTEGALTKAATVNNGVWDMSVAFSSDILFSETYFADEALSDERSEAAYALVAKTANGDVASAYDVTVDENKITLGALANFVPADLEGNANETIDLTETFGDNMKNVVAYYFTLDDKTAASTIGATLNGDKLVATKKGTVKVNVHYLLVDGTYAGDDYNVDPVTINVNIAHVAAETTLAPVEWTINGGVNSSYVWNKNIVYLNIEGIKSLLNPTSDSDKIYVKVAGDWTWTDGSELDSKSVVVNKVVYGKGGNSFAGNGDSWIADIEEGVVRRNNSSKSYATSYARSQVVKFTFDPANAFPGEYMTTLEFRLNSNSGDAIVSVPVKVIIKAPATNALARVNEFFDGDNAVIYGVANGTNVVADLFDLYKDFPKSNGTGVYESDYVTFEDEVYNADYDYDMTPWVSGSAISVATNGYNYGDYNTEDVYTTRAIYVTYKAFNNPHIPYVYDEFNLTVKSEIAEGTLDGSNVNAVIPNSAVGTPVNVSLKNIIAKDVYGVAYKLAPTYKYCEEHKVYDIPNNDAKDSRLQSVTFEAGEGFDKFIEVSSAADQCANDGFSAFTVKRKSGIAITGDVECTVVMKVKDNWGRTTKTNIKVTLKK